MILNSLRNKLILAAMLLVLPIGAYYSGKFVEGNACASKAEVHALKSEIKGRNRQDEIAKDVRKLSDAERTAARKYWMR